MSANLHLLLLLVTALAAAVTLSVNWEPGSRVIRTVLYGSVPVLLIGLICQLLMLAGNKPLLEWVIPLVGILLIGGFCKSDGVFRVATIVAPVAAIALVMNFLNVAHRHDTTNAPDVRTRITEQHQKIALRNAGDRLLSEFDPETEFPAGPINNIVNSNDSESGIVDITRVLPEWHSSVSRLYRVEKVRGIIWYPGGQVKDASEHLEIRVQ